MKRIKNIFNTSNTTMTKKPPAVNIESKNKNIALYAPDLEMHYRDGSEFTVQVYEDYKRTFGDERKVSWDIKGVGYSRLIPEDTKEARIIINLLPGKYVIKSKFPLDDPYAPCVISHLRVHDIKDEIEINTDVRKTKLYAPDMRNYINSEGRYLVKLMDGCGNPIANEEIEIIINETSYKRITDEEGFADVYVELDQGVYPIEVNYNGNDEHDPVSAEAQLTVLIRPIDREVVINVENLTMEFKISKDKIDTLKEYVIRTLKRNKTEKEKIRVLDDLSFKVYEGERMGILGFNGAGKSTLLKVLSGIYEPTDGKIEIKGKIAPLLELGAGFDNNYSGKNNIYLNGAFLSMTEDFIDSKYDEIVEFSELGEFINYPIKNYSSGMRAKLGFSIATLVNPDILIIDEILSVGDIKFKKKSSEKLRSLIDSGVTVLLVSHSIAQIRSICDRCIWIEDGQIVMEGESNKVCDAYLRSTQE